MEWDAITWKEAAQASESLWHKGFTPETRQLPTIQAALFGSAPTSFIISGGAVAPETMPFTRSRER